ncbi:MAG: hypothetical protein WAW42_15190 [Candidatus Competibacteraceae bacterium]|jgi:hypothetical protein
MTREEWKEFYRWLETASDSELRRTLDKIEGLLSMLKDRDVQADALRMRREIEGELLSRSSRP